jgi:hypothetical protein
MLNLIKFAIQTSLRMRSMKEDLSNLRALSQRPFRYYYDDGLVELSVGVLWAVAGLAIASWALTPPSSLVRLLGIGLLIGVPLIGTWGLKRLVTKVKERWVHPRTGFVEYASGARSAARWIVILAALVLASAPFWLPDRLNRVGLVAGAILAVALVTLGYRAHLARFYWLSACAALVGLGATWWTGSDAWSGALTFGITGRLMALSGGRALGRYFSAFPEPPPDSPA